MNTPNMSRLAPLVGTETKFSVSDLAALIFMIIGAISWGLVGAFGFGLVAFMLGPMTLASHMAYVLVGFARLSGLTIPMRLRPHRCGGSSRV